MNQKGEGFTLIESLVTMAMVAILSLAIIPFYQNAKAQSSLDRSASKLAQDVRGIMEKAMSSRDYAPCNHPNYNYGYGIYLEDTVTGSYNLIADCNGNRTWDQGTDRVIETVSFEPGVVISNLSRSNTFAIFEPPEPFVFIVSGDDSANIVLQSSIQPSRQRTININKAGLIDID